MHLSKPLKTRNTIGALTTTMAQVCGPSTIRGTVRAARLPPAQQPMQTLPLLTPWTATLTRNDNCARVKCTVGSGWQSHTTSYGCCSLMMWECQSLPSFSCQASSSSSFLIASIHGSHNLMSPKGFAPPRVSGLSPYSRS